MATVDKNFKIKNGLIVGDSTNLVNYTSASPSDPFVGQLWISGSSLYAWSSASTWVLIGDGNTGGGGGSASGTQFNIPSTLIARSASGSFQIGAVDFHTASPVSTAVGRITWDDGSSTALLGLKGGNINLPIGQQEDALVYNGTGSALARGQVVRIVGAQGQRPRIDLAAAISDANSSKTFGIVAEPILNAAEGFVTTFGIVSNINTAAFTEGASLWLSPSAGGIVSTMPIQPYHNVFLGYCLKSHASAGRIFVKIQNGYEIEELHDVLVQTASNNQILSYNSASSLWMNKDLQAAIKEVDGANSGIDADLLDGQQGSYYLDWTNTTNKPDPIIGVNLTGNTTAAASVTLTDLTNGQISLTTNTNFATSASTINWSGITGLAQFPDGTAAAPSITNTGDNNTGIFFPEEDTIAFSEGGAEVMRINAAAQVVIPGGTSASPALTRAGGTTTGIFFPDGAQMAFSTQGTERWRITSGGSFISSTNVSFQPQIQIKNTNTDTSAGYLIFQKSPTDNSVTSGDTLGNIIFQGIGTDGVDKTSALITAAADGPNTASNVPSSIRFSTSTGTTSTPERMRITSAGNIGIGTTNPNRTLSVIGTASFTGDIAAPTHSGLLLGNAMSASSINWAGVTGIPTTLSGYGITDAIPVSSSQSYLTRSDAIIIYAPLASASLTGTPIAPTAASGTNTQQIATTAFVRTEVSNLIASAPATLDTLNELAAALGNDPNFATSTASAIGQRLLASTASTLYMSIGSTANHATSASSINWNGVTNRPDPIIGVSLSGNTSGAASVTLTDLNNGQISITTNTAHANTASSIAGALVTGTVTNATNATTLTTARNIGDVSFNGSANIVPQRIFFKDTRSDNYNPLSYPGVTLHLKSNTTDGLTDGGTYHGILDLTHWNDLSGGVVHQLGLTDNGNMFIRYSTSSSTWSSWDQFAKLSSGRVLLSASSTISQLSLHANTASSIAGSLVTGIVNNALHSNTASSIAGSLVTGTVANATNASHSSTASSINASLLTGTTLPAAIINSSLTSVGTLTNLSVTNVISGRSASANFSVHSLTASSISGTLVTGTVNNANHANTASSINSSLITGTTLPAAIVNSSLTNVGTLGSLTVSGNLTVDTDTLFIDSINNRVGIRTTSPSATLHVNATSTTAPSLTWGANSGQILRNENSELAIGLSNSTPFPLYFQGRTNTNTSRQIVLQPLGGNVGIGGDPSRTFTVVGTASFTGDISAPTHSGLLLGNAMTASSIAGSLVTGTVNNANQANTASSINISGVTGLASNISTFLQTPTSANLAAAVTDESGTAGAVAFTNNPTFTGTLNAQTIDATNGILVEAYTKDNINLRTDGGFFQTSIATTASGWPQTTNSWYHLISSTHSNTGNYYSMQFAGSFFDPNALFYRATNGSGTTSWNQLWHSGNISAASVSWGNVSNKPDPIIGVNLLGDVTGAASATLTDLTNGQITINTTVAANSVALGTDTTGNYVAGATAGNGITISGTAGEGWSPTIELNAAASVSWGNVSSKPSPIIGVNLTGVVTGAASATLTQLTNGQVSITTNTNIVRNVISSSPTYNLVLTDAGDLVELNHSSSIVLVVPLNSTAAFPVGTKIDILQIGAGQVTASAASGVTLNSAGGRFKLTSQWSAATLIKRDTDSWALIGDLS